MYSTYDTPGEFFNISPTATGYGLSSATISLGCSDHATADNRFLTNISAAQADPTTGSTAQLVFGINDALYQRFNAIKLLDAANAPNKFKITRAGYTDEVTGELVYTFTTTIRVTPGSLVAVNS